MVNGSVPILMDIFLFFWPTFLFSVPILWKLHFLHPFSVLNLWESSSYYYRSNPSSPVCPARGPLQALREEALWRLAVVHLCVTTNTSGVPLSERSPKFGQPSWSSPFLLPSADFSTCLFLPVVITSATWVTVFQVCCCSVAQSRLTLCDPVDCSTPGLPCPSPHLAKGVLVSTCSQFWP